MKLTTSIDHAGYGECQLKILEDNKWLAIATKNNTEPGIEPTLPGTTIINDD